ncbi:hypothetical protein BTR23_01015 [Alkalihalophilus pseudofirmus]|nr:hypothetical protein BTR23_01015 [Alkalihalophilus pseudofirmus]
MEFVTGGAFNGKRSWVYSHYKIDHIDEFVCYNGYEEDVSVDELTQLPDRQVCVIFGMDTVLKRFFLIDDGRAEFNLLLNHWIEWERMRNDRTLVLVGNDIGKGIVPIQKQDRIWRDLVGWCYQDIVKKATKVYRVWYGISEQLK